MLYLIRLSTLVFVCLQSITLAEAANEVAVAEKNTAYEKACSSCHMAYAPNLLPARSWEKLMQGLSNHFGEDASVEPSVAAEVTQYLTENAADKVRSQYSSLMLGLLDDNEVPLRISETTYFELKHDLVKPRMVVGNPDVKSNARCNACHQGVDEGNYHRFEVRIPHYYRKAGRFVFYPSE